MKNFTKKAPFRVLLINPSLEELLFLNDIKELKV